MLVSLNYFVFLPYIFSAMFKQQGYDVKELPEEDCDLFIDCSGTLKVTSYKKKLLVPWNYACKILWYICCVAAIWTF